MNFPRFAPGTQQQHGKIDSSNLGSRQNMLDGIQSAIRLPSSSVNNEKEASVCPDHLLRSFLNAYERLFGKKAISSLPGYRSRVTA